MSTAALGEPTPLSVLVVDDSALLRRFVRSVVSEDPGLRVVAEARDGREALALVESARPAVVLMDLNLPVMHGLEAIERIMAARPTPILVYSGSGCADDAAAAIAAGAVDVLAKPGTQTDRAEHAADLRRRLRLAGRARVITHPRGRLTGAPAAGPVPAESLSAGAPRLVAVGASTGGPPALSQVLGALPVRTGASVLVVQHIAHGFVEGLARWLDEICALAVRVAADGQRLRPGTVALAPSGLNLTVDRQLRVALQDPPPGQFHVPGIDVTFESVARALGARSVGVLLTGMGRDGAVGLERMRDAGALTIAQDEETSAVFGMPGAAVARGAAGLVLGLPEIGPKLAELLDGAAE